MSTDIDPALFRETLGHYPTGVAVVTAMTERGTPAGMVIGTFSSVSMDPPLIAFYPTKASRTFAHLRGATAFCVNVLASDQEPLCRQFATGGESKFDGVSWRPGTLGAPILDGAVSWVECTYEDVREAGDHYLVLGRVQELAVERSTLPLLFFQGGYGRFSPGSFIAAPDPELIQAAQLAATVRTLVEDLSVELSAHCSVLARIGWDVVQVLAADGGDVPLSLPLGHRQTIVPPLGAIFLVDSTDDVVDEWLSRASESGQARRDVHAALLEKVRERGYSALVADPEVLGRHQAALSAFELSDRLPRQERVVQEATSALVDLYSPDLVPGQRYDIESIVVRMPTPPGAPPMGIRLTGLPKAAATEQVDDWVERLKRVAASAAVTTARR